MNNLRYFACVAFALGSLTVAGCSSDSGPDSTLHVQNNSDFSIVEIRVTSVGNTSWGPNLLGSDVLAPGETLSIDVTCDTYDALLVDESGVDCQLHSVDLCFNNAAWVINNNTCTVFSAAKAAREAAQAAGQTQGSAAPTAQ
jgi:hypothetical protein